MQITLSPWRCHGPPSGRNTWQRGWTYILGIVFSLVLLRTRLKIKHLQNTVRGPRRLASQSVKCWCLRLTLEALAHEFVIPDGSLGPTQKARPVSIKPSGWLPRNLLLVWSLPCITYVHMWSYRNTQTKELNTISLYSVFQKWNFFILKIEILMNLGSSGNLD